MSTVGDPLQHLVRPDAVERGEAGEQGNRDVHGMAFHVAESLAVGVGGHAEAAGERPAHRLAGAEPAPAGDRLDGVGCRLERAAGRFGAHGGDVLGWGGAHRRAEAADEVALAHPDPLGEHDDAVVAARVGVDRLLGGPDRTRRRTIVPDGCRELRLTARAAQEHHQPPRHQLGDVGAVVVLDEGEGEVDPGGDAGRRPHVAVAHEDRIGVDVDRRVPAHAVPWPAPSGW